MSSPLVFLAFLCYLPFPPSVLIHITPLCPHLFHYSSPLLSTSPTAPASFPTTVSYPSLCCSHLTSLLSSTHSPCNKHCNEDPYWIVVFAISLWVDSVIAFIHQGLCETDPANSAFAFQERVLDDLSIKKLQRFSYDGKIAQIRTRAPAFITISLCALSCTI